MKKEIKFTYGGANAKMHNLLVNRLMPNKYVDAIGPFVYLDHVYPTLRKPEVTKSPCGDFEHPHRGISTLTYMLSGELEHADSCGNHGIVHAGGLQWMNAGSGISYNDNTPHSFQETGGMLHLLKFWINLPAENKQNKPEYLIVQAAEIPEVDLPYNAGTIRILIGNYGIISAVVKTYSRQFIYHIKLNPKSVFTFRTKVNLEYAAFIPTDGVEINNNFFSKSELIIFQQDEGDIVFSNHNISEVDIIMFGGEPYTEAIIAEGPFVMNSQAEIAEAYNDFHLGKYGTIK